jgi:hypothetical protein
MRVIYRYKLVNTVPLDGSASYAQIAERSNLPEQLIKRMLRAAMANHIFAESAPGQVRHTAITRLWVTNPGFTDMVGMHLEEMGIPALKYVDALEKWGYSQEGNETAWNLVNDSNKPMLATLGEMPERARRFGACMQYLTSSDDWDVRHVLDAFDWKSIDQPGYLVLDVGGGQGQISQAIARHTQNISFIVQDLPHVVKKGTALLSPEFKERIKFQAHSFFEPEIQEGDLYFFRWILHDWSDKYATQILKNLVPKMKNGTKILICEWVLEDRAVTAATKKMGCNLDVLMATCFNSRERTAQDFESLFREADERYKWKGVTRPAESSLSLIEVVWQD